MQCGVQPNPLQIPLTSLGIGVSLEVGNVGGVVRQLMPTNTRQPNKVRQVTFEHLVRVLKWNQDIRIKQEP
uniref:Uncharacterized protein n=1 Tax=Ralstonia solanacearum TaxID=305 RepID=A0A0S4WE69_RALSL|nr:protein of unknown function [Ralstonia solanacearum]